MRSLVSWRKRHNVGKSLCTFTLTCLQLTRFDASDRMAKLDAAFLIWSEESFQSDQMKLNFVAMHTDWLRPDYAKAFPSSLSPPLVH